MYDHHFGLTKTPFKITPDPELFFAGGNRGAVLDALLYAIARGEGIVKVVGEVGSGKTMLCRMLERELPPHCEIIYLANPNLDPDDILHAIVFELKLSVPANASKPEITHLLHEYLLRKHANNRRVVMFVEEAQCVPLATLEAIRMLSNLETAHDKLLQIVLFGQPELDVNLSQHAIRQLNERITYRFRLAPLAARDIRDYLNSRLRASGFRGTDLFETRAVSALTRHSSGLLRRINVLADKALLAAYSDGKRKVTRKHVMLAVRDSELVESARGWGRRWSMAALGVSIIVTSLWPLRIGVQASIEQTALIQNPSKLTTAKKLTTVAQIPIHFADLTLYANSEDALHDPAAIDDTHTILAYMDGLNADTAPVLSFKLDPVSE